jgi:hypothetical protein
MTSAACSVPSSSRSRRVTPHPPAPSDSARHGVIVATRFLRMRRLDNRDYRESRKSEGVNKQAFGEIAGNLEGVTHY